MKLFKSRGEGMEQEHSPIAPNVSLSYVSKDNDAYKRFAHFSVTRQDGVTQLLDIEKIKESIAWAITGCESAINVDLILQETLKNIFDGIIESEIADALILASAAFVEHEPSYGHVAARLLFKKLYKEVTKKSILHADVDHLYSQSFIQGIKFGVEHNLFDKRMLDYDLQNLALNLVPERDHLFDYMGLRTLYDRYFIKYDNIRIELPQVFWMRVAMGLACNEPDKNTKVVEFYTVMSLMRYVPSTPTLLHAALVRPQLSSCFLSTVKDDLKHIFKCIGDNAQISKWSGGLANDWTNIRATGAWIKSIKTESQGVIPYLKIANDVTAAINRSGKRRSASVVYLETWHYDIEDFLDLRRNTGDERRRTHDINTANWIPDLFMQRVKQDGMWTLFSPEEVPGLHSLYGKAFKKRYEEYEQKVEQGTIKLFKKIPAKQLWRKMLSRLFETGHPWITFKDACNIRSPQDHAGVIHSSNLCTEITLNTSENETAVCNLGSINLARHIVNNTIDEERLAHTIKTAIRMLDNVIDLNFYPTIETKNSNVRHRPIGLGLMGLQDAYYMLDINFDSEQALLFADNIMEKIAYHAILSSSQLAKERGIYASYKGSKWDRNIFPQDTIALLEQERDTTIAIEKKERLDWTPVREHVQKYGMRHSNTMAIAPTATISNIAGCFPSIEPIYKNMYVKANMSGEFTIVNKYLVKDLQKLDLWDQDMLDQIKYYDGNLGMITRIPQWIKEKYKEAFVLDPIWLIQISAARGRWIDQSQSHNVFMQGVSGKKLDQIYMTAWELGLKTMYYLRTLGATQIEKSTLDAKKFGFTQKREYTAVQDAHVNGQMSTNDVRNGDDNNGYTQAGNKLQLNMASTAACSISSEPDCDVCQ